MTSAKYCRDPCSVPTMGLMNYRMSPVRISFHTDWQIDNGFFNRPIMAHTQILVHRWGPRTRIFLVMFHRLWDLTRVYFHLWCRLFLTSGGSCFSVTHLSVFLATHWYLWHINQILCTIPFNVTCMIYYCC